MLKRCDNNLIFDIGMHVGQDTDYYLKKGYRVLAIEANPVLAQQANEEFRKAIASGKLVIKNIGVGAESGSFPFYVNETYSEWSSFIEEIGARDGLYHVIDVPCTTADELFREYGVPYYLKVDIEGHDRLVVDQLIDMDAKPRYVSVENGNGGLLETLHKSGYEKFKFINQATVAEMTCPFPAKEGKYVDYDFPPGSSGPFGEDTTGIWKNREDVAREIDAYWNKPDRDASIDGWFDLHACLGNP